MLVSQCSNILDVQPDGCQRCRGAPVCHMPLNIKAQGFHPRGHNRLADLLNILLGCHICDAALHSTCCVCNAAICSSHIAHSAFSMRSSWPSRSRSAAN